MKKRFEFFSDSGDLLMSERLAHAMGDMRFPWSQMNYLKGIYSYSRTSVLRSSMLKSTMTDTAVQVV